MKEKDDECSSRKAILEELNKAMAQLEQKNIALEEQSDAISGNEAKASILSLQIEELGKELKKRDEALARETESREQLDQELVAVRDDLAEAEKELDKSRAAQAQAEKIAAETKAVFELQAAEASRRVAELEGHLVQVFKYIAIFLVQARGCNA